MKPDGIVQALEAALAETQSVLAKQVAALTAVRAAFGLVEVSEQPTSTRTRGAVRRGRAAAAKALRTESGRRKAPADGSLASRIVSTLTAFQAPMKKSAVIEAAKAPADAVKAELNRLRKDGAIVMVGERAAARWSLPKFPNVIVAEDAA